MKEATLDLMAQTRLNFPIGATGFGRDSIVATNKVVGNNPITYVGEVVSNLDYVEYIEKGTRPHTSPIAPLKRWAVAVLGNEGAAYAVRAKIRRRGTRAQRPFERAVAMMAGQINSRLARAVREEERALND